MSILIKKVHGHDMGVVVKTCCLIKSPVFVMGVRVFDRLRLPPIPFLIFFKSCVVIYFDPLIVCYV